LGLPVREGSAHREGACPTGRTINRNDDGHGHDCYRRHSVAAGSAHGHCHPRADGNDGNGTSARGIESGDDNDRQRTTASDHDNSVTRAISAPSAPVPPHAPAPTARRLAEEEGCHPEGIILEAASFLGDEGLERVVADGRGSDHEIVLLAEQI
jgi:hypothetical protein